MKKAFLLLALFSLTASSQNRDEKLYANYKREGDKLFREGHYSKAAAQYQSAKQSCPSCKDVVALIDSCTNRQRLASASKLNETSKPEKAQAPEAPIREHKNIDASMGALAPHGQLTQFSDMEYNFVSTRVQSYLRSELNMVTDEDDVTADRITLQFKERSSYNAPQKALKFDFGVKPVGNEFVIKDCKITGDRQKLISFYVKYWPTTMQIDETKTGLVATTRLLSDDALLYLNGNKSYIVVRGRENGN